MYDPARDIFKSSEETPASEDTVPAEALPQLSKPAKRAATEEIQREEGGSVSYVPNKKIKSSSRSRESLSRKRYEPYSHVPPRENDPRQSHSPRHPLKRGRTRSRSPYRHKEQRQFSRRTPPPRRRSPTPPPRSPPRERKRPGAASRIAAAEKDALRQRQIEREHEQQSEAQATAATRGVHDVVRQHYNLVPQRGRVWRKTDSRIRGLRNYNNWVKSVLIQKFSPNESFRSPGAHMGYGEPRPQGLLVLDIGCGKGGDLGKWQKAPQPVDLYVGIDPAEVSIEQARERYEEMYGRSRGRLFQGHFFAKDGYGEWLGEIPIIRDVGIDGNVGPGGGGSGRWQSGGFDIVTMMFCMHYAFESEAKARGMLRNVAGGLKKGGRFIGVIPNSDVLRVKVEAFHKEQDEEKVTSSTENQAQIEDGKEEGKDAEAAKAEETEVPEWGNGIYRVRFPGETPKDGIFRPPYGWKYTYTMEEAVEEVPEYVVPWEAFRALAEDYNLEMQYRKPFLDIWKEERDDQVLGPLAQKMGVMTAPGEPVLLTEEEREAVSFYHAFCFYKV